VEWDGGQEEKVKADAPNVYYAFDGSRRLEWILNPNKLRLQFADDPVSVFIDVIKDEGKVIQTAQIKRRLLDLGLDKAEVDDAFDKSRPALRRNRHVVITSAAHSWSEVEVDPHKHLRNMSPPDALQHLLTTPRLKAEEKEALADAIRAGFRR
jgi:hypothetical protein